MNEIIESTVKELSDRATQKGLQIIWEKPGKPSPVTCDDDKVRHVVFNFIDNAIKYSDHGQIAVTVRDEDGGIVVRVADQGLGFGQSDEVNFFQKFYRGENVKKVEVTGTGLGLFVCRKFIEAHQGRVWATSPGLGKGSEFGFWIPLNPGTGAPAGE